MALFVVSHMDAAYDAVNVFIMWNTIDNNNGYVRYVRMYAPTVRTIDKPRMPHIGEHVNNHSYVWTQKKKDHGIVDT